MMREMGYCNGIENYSRILDGRTEGQPPFTLLDYFPSDFIVLHRRVAQHRAADRRHVRGRPLAQVGAGRARLPAAVGDRQPAAAVRRVLQRVDQVVFVSATPGAFELRNSEQVVEQIIRPTGLVDPEVELRPTQGPDRRPARRDPRPRAAGERVLVTTLTKKMAEDLTDYLLESGVRTRYLHSEVDTLERIQIVRALRLGEYDVLVGVNLLREGLDLPEVSLVAILDADKEGFLRGQTALIQTIGRAARNINGRVLMYADKETEAIRGAVARDQPPPRDPAGATTRSTASRR